MDEVCAHTLCSVCTAKHSGTRVPKRKCTCDSGDTVTRNRAATSRWPEVCSRDANVCMFGAKWYMMDDVGDAEFEELDVLAYQSGIVGSTRHDSYMKSCKAGDLDVLRLLGTRGSKDMRYSWQLFWREAFSNACEGGHVEVVRYLLSVVGNVTLSTLCPYDSEYVEPYVGIPNPAPPLWIASNFGHAALVSFLVQQHADPSQAAFDGTTPFYMACHIGDIQMVQHLHTFGVDMLTADQDGTAPLHVAAASGHLPVIRFLQQQGVSMQMKGTVYLDSEFKSAAVNATALAIAQRCGHAAVVRFLQPDTADSAEMPAQKRQHSELSMNERAARLGVAHRLKPIPPELEVAIASGAPDARAAAKKQKQKIQIHNQQIVSRAENARMKQMTLPFS